MTEKLVFTSSQLEIQHQRGSAKQAVKFASCAVGKDTYGIPSSKCGKQMAGNSYASSCSAPLLSVIVG